MRLFLALLAIVLSIAGAAQRKPGKLIVLIAVDGLRGDLLNKYDKALTGGLRRMKNEGFYFTNAWVDHGVTVSHAGHVTLATGMHPKNHGIVDAAFYEKTHQGRYKFTDAFQDSTYSLINCKEKKSVSPDKVLTSGISEWVKRNHPSARTLSIGTGNISAALYSFKPGSEVYWYDASTGGYVSSTFYQENYPEWIQQFNATGLQAIKISAQVWENTIPDALRKLAYDDNVRFESRGRFNSFPHEMSKEMMDIKDSSVARNVWLSSTPFCDIATLRLAESGVQELGLGMRNSIDLLTIVLSQVDNTAHYYGAFSQESYDALVRIDKALGEFFTVLDKKLGKNNYVVGLSSDHGFPDIPEISSEKGIEARRIDAGEIEDVLQQVQQIRTGAVNPSDAIEQVSRLLLKKGFVSEVYLPEQLGSGTSNCKFLSLFQNSYRSDRVPRLPFFSLQNFRSPIAEMGLIIRLKENSFIDLDVTIHGSAYDYDRHVPILFFGSGVRKGKSDAKVNTVDVAPTLAALGGLTKVPKVDGKIILELLP